MVKHNIWLFFLGVMIGTASGYAAAHHGLVRERQRCSEGMSSILRQEWNVKQLLKMERELAQKAAIHCTVHGSMAGFDQDAVWKELQKKYDNQMSMSACTAISWDMPCLSEP